MSDDKKYYYLKLKDNFFDSDEIIVLESMPDGHLYCNILLKLYLRSLKNEGKLMFNYQIPYNSTILAQVVRQPVGVVEKAIDIFKQYGLIEVLDNGAIYMLDIQNYIGKSSTEADRQRKYQHKISDEKILLIEPECKKPNIKTNGEPNRKPTPEIELEKERELKLKKELEIPFVEIVNYLNLKAKTRYKATGIKTKDLIRTRWNEDFILEDFKKVIDIKTNEWLKTEWEKFLRPETLFSNKFEGYLNQKSIAEKKEPKPYKDFGTAY